MDFPDSEVPIYRQPVTQMVFALLSANLQPGERLPSSHTSGAGRSSSRTAGMELITLQIHSAHAWPAPSLPILRDQLLGAVSHRPDF